MDTTKYLLVNVDDCGQKPAVNCRIIETHDAPGLQREFYSQLARFATWLAETQSTSTPTKLPTYASPRAPLGLELFLPTLGIRRSL